MSKYLILETLVALLIAVSAAGRNRDLQNEPRARMTKEIKFKTEEIGNDVLLTTTETPDSHRVQNNATFTNAFPVGESRQGRSKKIIIIPKSKGNMLSLPKVYLTAGVATQSRIRQGGGGGGWGWPPSGGGGGNGGGSGSGWGGGGGGGGGGGNIGGSGGGWGSGGGGGNIGGSGGGWGSGGGGGGGGFNGWGSQGGGGGGGPGGNGGGWGQQNNIGGGSGGGWGSPVSMGWGPPSGGGFGGTGSGEGWGDGCSDKKAQKAKKKAQRQKAKAKKKAQKKGGGGWSNGWSSSGGGTGSGGGGGTGSGWGSSGGSGGSSGGGGNQGWDRWFSGRPKTNKHVAWYPDRRLGEPTRTDDSLVEEDEVWPNSPPRSSRIDTEVEFPVHNLEVGSYLLNIRDSFQQSNESREDSHELQQNGDRSQRREVVLVTNDDKVSYEQVEAEIGNSRKSNSKENLPLMLSFKLVCPPPKPWYLKARRIEQRQGQGHNCVYVQVEP